MIALLIVIAMCFPLFLGLYESVKERNANDKELFVYVIILLIMITLPIYDKVM